MSLRNILTGLCIAFIVLSPCPSTNARKEEKRKLEILHAGKSLEELVNLGAHVDPHDITMNGLAESIEPKLMEETHQERMMLQQNGIEDPYPLDATIEYEHHKKLPKPIIATETNPKDKSSFNYEDPEDTRYDSNEMPEYDVETKADYKANQEAADWLMHDPNKFNVMPDEDTKNLFNDDKELNEKGTDDPIRMDNKQDSVFQNFNDDNQEMYTKIQESLAPDSNMEKIYSKYEKFLNKFDQKLKGMNKNVKEENEFGDVENDVFGDDSAVGDVTAENDDSMNYDSDANSKKVNEMTSVEDGTGSQNDENNVKTSKEKEIALDEALKIKLLKKLQEKIKINQEKEIENRKHKNESSTTTSDEGKENGPEIGRHDNTSSDKSGSSVSAGSTTNLLPVFRISHLNKPTTESQERDVSPRVGAPSTERGTSRQNVDINRESFGMSRPYLNHGYGGIAKMMFGKNRDAQPDVQGIKSLGQTNTKMPKLQFHPQDPEDAQGRHGIPSRFGQWNGWSKCSVSCDTGSQIRARICLRLPCQSRDLYEIRKCTRNICPGKWRKESLKAHNTIRALHHSPPLMWSNSLAHKAKQLADTLASRNYIGSQDLHEENGENIAQLRLTKDSDSLAQKAVDLWYDEIKSYSFSYPEINPKDRHFIQMVWKKTKTLGMASTQSPSGEYTFVVALYGGPDIDNKLLHDNVLRAGQKHDVYTTFKRSRGPHVPR